MDAKKEKLVTITVNTVDHTVEKEKISHEEVVRLVYPEGTAPINAYIVRYSKGNSGKYETLAPGDQVNVKDGMDFRVSPTGES